MSDQRSAMEVMTGVRTRRQISYDFPIAPDLVVRLNLPADLTEDEAARVGRFVDALAVPDGSDG